MTNGFQVLQAMENFVVFDYLLLSMAVCDGSLVVAHRYHDACATLNANTFNRFYAVSNEIPMSCEELDVSLFHRLAFAATHDCVVTGK